METNEVLYWGVEIFTSDTINLLGNSNRIYSDKLTKKQVEQLVGTKLRVARSYEDPDIIVNAMVEKQDREYIDTRVIRGRNVKYYVINN